MPAETVMRSIHHNHRLQVIRKIYIFIFRIISENDMYKKIKIKYAQGYHRVNI